jgi:hypothetical protein
MRRKKACERKKRCFDEVNLVFFANGPWFLYVSIAMSICFERLCWIPRPSCGSRSTSQTWLPSVTSLGQLTLAENHGVHTVI